MNTKCDHKCGHGFYTVDLISSCLPCTQCCDDGKDELAMECMNNKKKCKVRYSTCTQVHTTPWKPPDRSYNSSSTLSTTQTLPLESDTTTTQVNKEEKAVSDQLITSVTPDLSVENEALKGEAVQPGKQDGTSIVVILLTVVLAMCLVLSALVITKKFLPGIGLLRSSREQNRENGGNTITSRQPSSQSRHWSASHKSGQDSVSLLFNRPESSQTNRSESPQSSGCTTVSFNRPESSQSSRPECPKINMSAGSPQPDGCNLPQPSGYTQSQLNRFPSHLPRLTASEQSSQFAQPQDKSNLGESIFLAKVFYFLDLFQKCKLKRKLRRKPKSPSALALIILR